MQRALQSNPNAGSPVKYQCRLSGQIPMPALWSNPNAGSPVKSQHWLSGQIPMPALRSNPNAGSPVKSQRWLSSQIPTPAVILKPGAGSSFKFYRTQFIVTSTDRTHQYTSKVNLLLQNFQTFCYTCIYLWGTYTHFTTCNM